jgi:hypothetical protein
MLLRCCCAAVHCQLHIMGPANLGR